MPFAAALSEHPRAADATAEVVGSVLDRLGSEPDLAILFVSAAHVPFTADIARTVRRALAPRTLLGTTTISVVGGAREVEHAPAIALWAGRLGAVQPVRLSMVRTERGPAVVGLDRDQLAAAATLVLLTDPIGFPVDDTVAVLAREAPHLTVVGGVASAGVGPGTNRFVLDDDTHPDGAVGVLLGPDQAVEAIVSQGCRPVGEPLVVTRAEGNVVHEIAGRPALWRLEELLRSMDETERRLVHEGLHIGIVIDEHKVVFDRGDFLVRDVTGADRDTGAIAIGDVVEVGATVQFQVRDAAAADEELRLLLANRLARGGLLFTCTGRGQQLFGRPHHDAGVVAPRVNDQLAGMFCAGELGPVGARSFVHTFSASVVLFSDPT